MVESTRQRALTFLNSVMRCASSSPGALTQCSEVQHRSPGESEIKGTARWEGEGQLSALGNALAQGYDWFRKAGDSPCEGGSLCRGANISCEPTAASEWLCFQELESYYRPLLSHIVKVATNHKMFVGNLSL